MCDVFLGQACLFYLPSVFWNNLNQKAGVDADNILASAQSFEVKIGKDARQRTLDLICNQLDRAFSGKSGYVAGVQMKCLSGK